jgi:hypothetical protein
LIAVERLLTLREIMETLGLFVFLRLMVVLQNSV